MKIYCVAGRYLRTQDEAKARAKEKGITFSPATDIDDVPTDAKGLIAYLNELVEGLSVYNPSPAPPALATSTPEPLHSVMVDEAFEGLPITHQLTLTALALENARSRIVELETGQRGGFDTYKGYAELTVEDDAEDFI